MDFSHNLRTLNKLDYFRCSLCQKKQIYEMELVTDDHAVVSFAEIGWRDDIYVIGKYVYVKESWKHPHSTGVGCDKRSVKVMSVYTYIHLTKKAGIDFTDEDYWYSLRLCDSVRLPVNGACIYCTLLARYPDVELDEIEKALLDASGTLQQRATAVLQGFSCSTVKPAKN